MVEVAREEEVRSCLAWVEKPLRLVELWLLGLAAAEAATPAEAEVPVQAPLLLIPPVY